MQLKQALLAILYTAGEQGVTIATLAEVLQADQAALRQQLTQLQQQLNVDDTKALMIAQYGKKYRLLTKPAYQGIIDKYLYNEQASNLSQAAVEILAIIAYKQPITRVEIDSLRGVKNSSSTLQSLQNRRLITTKGRKEVVGRPIMYITTDKFLNYFGLHSLADLPDLANFQNESKQHALNIDLFSEK